MTGAPARAPRASASLRWRILLALSLAAMLPTVVVGALAIMRVRDDVVHEVSRGGLAHIRALGAVLDSKLQDAWRTLELGAASWADAPGDRGDTDLLLRRLRRDIPIIRALSILDPGGTLRSGDPVPAKLDIGSHSFGGYVGDVEELDGSPVVYLVVQARGRTGELMGVFVAGLDLGFVHDLLSDVRALSRPEERIIVVDGSGILVGSSDERDAAGRHGLHSLAGVDPAVDAALGSTTEGTLTSDGWVSAYQNLSSFQSQRGVRWAILHEQREARAYALARDTTRDTLIIGGAALAIALALGAYFATRLTRPLAALARHADAIAAGSTDDPPPVRGPGEIGLLGERIDEMARRIAERAALQAALARGDRLASVGVMSAQVAHEINNPLTTVLGYAILLQEGKPPGHPDREALELIASEAERMKSIVSGLLEYARAHRKTARDPAAPAGTSSVSCNPAAVLRHAGALLEPQLRRTRTTLVLDVTTTAPVAIEAHALQQVLVNLGQNAAQAMAEAHIAGTLTITARPAPGGVATLITVTDEGPGVPPGDRTRIFDPFYTTKDASLGTGLGLAVCKHLIATAGGSIEVGDGPRGRGAEFRVVIPNAP